MTYKICDCNYQVMISRKLFAKQIHSPKKKIHKFKYLLFFNFAVIQPNLDLYYHSQ